MDEEEAAAHPLIVVRGFGICIAVAGMGCGPVVGVEATGDEGGTTSTTDGDDSTAGGDRGGSTGSDASDGGSEDTDVGPTAGICGAAASQPLAIVSASTTAMLVRADGSMSHLDIHGQAVPADASPYLSIDAQASYVAVALAWTWVDDGIHYGSEVSLFDDDGIALWHASEPGASIGNVHVGVDGSIVATRTQEDGASEGVAYEGGVASSLPSFTPGGPKRADGFIPGRFVELGDSRRGWLRTNDLAFVTLSAQPIDNWARLQHGDYLYVTADEPVPSLMLESPDSAEVLPMTGVELPPDSAVHVSHASSTDWLLVHGDDGAPWFRVAVATGLAQQLDLTPPDGWQWLECYGLAPVIDAWGRILLPARDAWAARLQRLDPDAETWMPVGAAVTRIDMMNASVHGETIVVTTDGENTTFCPPQAFEPAADLLEGALWQVVRPEHDIAYVLSSEAGWLGMRSDGTCAAIVDAAAETTTLLDVLDGTELELPGAYGVRFWRE